LFRIFRGFSIPQDGSSNGLIALRSSKNMPDSHAKSHGRNFIRAIACPFDRGVYFSPREVIA
jgi:hypothetical protein